MGETGLVQRFRFVCAISIVATLAFAFYDLAIVGAWMPLTFAAYAILVVGSMVLATIRIPTERLLDVVFGYFVVLVGLTNVATAFSYETPQQNIPTLVVVSTVFATGSAALFPWGARRQLALSSFIAGAAAVNYALVGHRTTELAGFVVALNLILAVFVSVLIAHQFAAYRDTAERRLAEIERSEALARTQAQAARSLAENLPAAVWTNDTELRLTGGNGSLFKALGVDVHEYLGVPASEFLADAGPDFPVVRALERALTGERSSFEGPLRGRRLLVVVEPTRDVGGTINGTIGVGFDVTDRANAERELRALNARLEDVVAQRTAKLESAVAEHKSFSYAVSHDLRQPLRAMHGFAEVLEEEYGAELDDRGREHCRRVRAAAARMSDMIDDLLSLSRLAAGGTAMDYVDLSETVDALIAELRAAEPDRVVTVDRSGDFRVWGDLGLLRLALQNVLANAWKFTRDRPRARVEVAAQPTGDGFVEISVTDNGVGFEPDQAARLLRPFQRLHSPQEFEGSGIGLATVQRIVSRHDGRVTVSSEGIGRGANVLLRLPTGVRLSIAESA